MTHMTIAQAGDAIIGLVVVVIVIVVNFVNWLIKQNEKARRAQGDEEPDFVAKPDQVRAFLENVGRPQPKPDVAVPQPAARRAPRPVDRARADVFGPAVAQTPVAAAPRASQPNRPKRRSSSKKAPRTRKPTARKQPAKPQPKAEPKQVLAAPISVAGRDLRKAVIWSEILGRPVSMRPGKGHRPPSLE